jgi:hypothetical protein
MLTTQFTQLTLDELESRCQQETDNFLSRVASDTRFCFELMRRALEDDIQDAFTRIYAIYQPMCANWVRTFRGFEHTGESSPDVFVNIGFAKLHQMLRGERFRQFATVAAVLEYLKRCAQVAVLQQLRKPSHDDQEDLEDREGRNALPGASFTTDIEHQQAWARINMLLRDDEDRLLAMLAFDLDLKPRDISARHPERWPTARDVSVALQRVMRTLRRDTELRQMFGLA